MVTDLTKGNPDKTLWKFTLPMIISVMFQQLYSTVDSIVAGQLPALTHLPLSARHIPSQCFLSLSQTVQISDALL
ncbi:MAG: hypothetical protein ACLSE9_08115 [Acutalibacteraceae bacterium]